MLGGERTEQVEPLHHHADLSSVSSGSHSRMANAPSLVSSPLTSSPGRGSPRSFSSRAFLPQTLECAGSSFSPGWKLVVFHLSCAASTGSSSSRRASAHAHDVFNGKGS